MLIEIEKLRKELHSRPELSGYESNTAKRIKKFIETHHKTEIIEEIGGHGLAAIYSFSEKGPCIMIRCELDALPIKEEKIADYQSRTEEVSHKCGHDGHMAIVAGLIFWIKEQDFKSGRIILLFQAAEETGEGVQRSEYQEYINKNKERIEQNKDYYRRRQAIVEYPFGTIKRQWGFSHIITKKYINRAEADVGLMFTAYNLRRIINIIGIDSLQEYLKEQLLLCLTFIGIIRLHLSKFKPLKITNYFNPVFIKNPLKRLIFSHLLIKNGSFWTN